MSEKESRSVGNWQAELNKLPRLFETFLNQIFTKCLSDMQRIAVVQEKDILNQQSTSLITDNRCHRCTRVSYCSDTCRKESWDTYHQTECPYLDILHSVGIAHLSLRVILTAGLQYLLETYIGSLLLRHIQQLVCNAHAITKLQLQDTVDQSVVESQSQVRVATAIYPTASLMNHSCDPTIISSFHKDTLVVRAIKDVKKGEEIYNCYGPHYKKMCREERQQVLTEQYFFCCQCPPCQCDESNNFNYYVCPDCSEQLTENSQDLYCIKCKKKQVLEEYRLKESKSGDLFVQALTFLEKHKVQDANQKLLECFKLRKVILHPHHKLMAETQDCLARCYSITGQFEKAVKFLKPSVKSVMVTYGEQSIEYANELQKYAEILVHAGRMKDAHKTACDYQILLTSVKPDIVLGTETWLSPEISSYEYFNSSEYTVYRRDRQVNSKNQSHGGVLIAISKNILSEEIVELQTSCESVWAEINLANARKLIVGCYYRPPSDNGESLDELRLSLGRLNFSSKSLLLLGGDFNLGHIDWSIPTVIPGKSDMSIHSELLSIINDYSLDQIVDKPTRGDKTLDLVLTNSPSLFNGIKILPSIGKSDHDIVFTECNVSLKRSKNQNRRIYKYSRADWSEIKTDVEQTFQNMQEIYSTSDINSLWEVFKNGLTTSMNKNIPQKTITNRMKHPWVNNNLKKQLNRNKRLHRKCKTNSKLKEKYMESKKTLQSNMRKAYWSYIENMIFDLPVNEPDNPSFKRTPKKLYSYIKNTKK
ncbi:hypothetical protein FSP39_021868 [Pinctada imbricata]|uniref:Protein-lysine N-methyltransferase SMYD4 n=1 Tax=Pinctada imbricata TaxID=66713 RepID=A0AA88YFD4_PINIB|nr:hypothetical protein FSP39_021868 [Pinctada imbricata]